MVQLGLCLLLCAAQAGLASWDIMTREVFDRAEHPFPPILFMVFRTVLCIFLNYCVALCIEGSDPIQPKASRRTSKGRPRARVCTLSFAFLSFLYVIITQTGYLVGVQLTTATRAAVMQPLVSPLTTALSSMFGAESWSSSTARCLKLMSCVFAVGGATIIIFGSKHHEPSEKRRLIHVNPQPIVGSLSILIEVLGFSIFYLLQKPLLETFKPVWLSFYLYLLALPMTVVMWGGSVLVYGWTQPIFSELVWAAVGFCGIITVLYSVAQTVAGPRLPASSIALFLCVHPIATAILSSVILQRHLTPWDIGGGFCIGTAFWFDMAATQSGKGAADSADAALGAEPVDMLDSFDDGEWIDPDVFDEDVPLMTTPAE